MKQSKTWFYYIFAISGVILGIWLDQYTKGLAVAKLKGQGAHVLIKDVFSLHYLENKGAAFGLFQNQKIFFVISTVLVLTAVIYCIIRIPKHQRFRPLLIIGPCIITGAVGNFIDRIRLGYVIDFFYFELIDFPIFNVADIFVTVSFVVLLILVMFYYKEEDLAALNIPFLKGKEAEK